MCTRSQKDSRQKFQNFKLPQKSVWNLNIKTDNHILSSNVHHKKALPRFFIVIRWASITGWFRLSRRVKQEQCVQLSKTLSHPIKWCLALLLTCRDRSESVFIYRYLSCVATSVYCMWLRFQRNYVGWLKSR